MMARRRAVVNRCTVTEISRFSPVPGTVYPAGGKGRGKAMELKTLSIRVPVDMEVRVVPLHGGYQLVADRRACFACPTDWDRMSNISTWNPAAAEMLVEWIRAADVPRPKVLAIGCGNGSFSRGLAEFGLDFAYTGCDIDPATIAIARREFGGAAATFMVAEAHALPFEDRSFDVVLFEASLNNMERFEDAVAEAGRVGASWVIVYCVQTTDQGCHLYYRRNLRAIFNIDTSVPEVTFDEAELLGLFRRQGFLLAGMARHTRRYLPLPGPEVCTATQKSLLFRRV